MAVSESRRFLLILMFDPGLTGKSCSPACIAMCCTIALLLRADAFLCRKTALQVHARSRKPEQHGLRRTSTKEEQGMTHQSSANTSGSMEGWASKGSGAAAQMCDDKARTDTMHYKRPIWCKELGWPSASCHRGHAKM